MRRALVAVMALSLLAGSGCQQLLFRQDDRIVITAPINYSTIRQPVTIRWQARDFVPGRDGTFMVFVDRSPMPPGEKLDYFNPRDREGIFATDRDSIQFDVIAPVLSNSVEE